MTVVIKIVEFRSAFSQINGLLGQSINRSESSSAIFSKVAIKGASSSSWLSRPKEALERSLAGGSSLFSCGEPVSQCTGFCTARWHVSPLSATVAAAVPYSPIPHPVALSANLV